MASDSRTGFPISPGSRPGHLSSRAILGRRVGTVKPPLTKRRPPRSVTAWRTRQGSTRRSSRLRRGGADPRAATPAKIAARAKPDGSPVTDADIAAEAAIRRIVETRFPQDGFYGEESAAARMEAEHVWIVDPIDGTKSFVRRYPMFSTQIAVMRRGRIELGVSSAPVYGETAWAEHGHGAWLGGAPLAVSRIAAIEQATLSTGNLRTLANGPRWPAFGRLVTRLDRIRGFGDFLHYHLLAAGKIDAVLESDIHVEDIAALSRHRRGGWRASHRSRGRADRARDPQRPRHQRRAARSHSRRRERLGLRRSRKRAGPARQARRPALRRVPTGWRRRGSSRPRRSASAHRRREAAPCRPNAQPASGRAAPR